MNSDIYNSADSKGSNNVDPTDTAGNTGKEPENDEADGQTEEDTLYVPEDEDELDPDFLEVLRPPQPEYSEPKPDDGFYKEFPPDEEWLKPDPNYEGPCERPSDEEHDDDHDDIRDPNYIKSINLDDMDAEIDLDRVDFKKAATFKKGEPEEYVIQSMPKGFVEDVRAVPIDIITREQWGARPRPQDEEPLNTPVFYVHMEYKTDSDKCSTPEECTRAVQDLQRKDIERGLPDIAHNFLIGGDGNAYEGRGWYINPERTNEIPKYSGKYLQFAFIGDYEEEERTDKQIKGQWGLLGEGMEKELIDEDFDFC